MATPLAGNPEHDADWSRRVETTLGLYAEPLLRHVTKRLLKPRSQWPLEHLIERCSEAQTNSPVLDRRIAELAESSRKTLALIGLSRRPEWRVGHLMRALATLGYAQGITPILDLLETGLLFPVLPSEIDRVHELTQVLNPDGAQHTLVFVHPFAAHRARHTDWDLPDFTSDAAPITSPTHADGLDWLLRMAAVWQLTLGDGPLRLTQARTLFKRDWQRLQATPLLTSAPLGQMEPVPDQGLFVFQLARASGILDSSDTQVVAGLFPEAWQQSLHAALAALATELPGVEDWDPLEGWVPARVGDTALPSLWPVIMLMLSQISDNAWTTSELICDWLWERHPSWRTDLNKDRDRGLAWLRHLFDGISGPMRLTESVGDHVRLAPLGRHLFQGQPLPPEPPEFRHTLTAQPTGEIIAYRQGLVPSLIAGLSHFAVWQQFGAACTLKLQAEQVYMGLERGFGLSEILRFLQRHGTREIPSAMEGLLRSWAGKRERLSVFTGTTLLEFGSAAELDEALSRGVVEQRITDRIGLISGNESIDWSHFRQIGNRDYEAPPRVCVTFDPDGVTFRVDAGASDLLLEAEIPLIAETIGTGLYRMTPASLARARKLGWSLADLERWCRQRSGEDLAAAGRMIYRCESRSASAMQEWIVTLPDEETTDGVVQWPITGGLIVRRVGPTDVAIHADNLEELQRELSAIGIDLVTDRPNAEA